ncbi:MAG TPA: ribonuclease P protein component [Labilithrix sp.]
MALGFGRDRRIRRRADFVRIQTHGERANAPHFVLLVSAREGGGASRLGVVVTKKVGNSVARSRVKRLCRECFRTWPGFVPDAVDLVVIARPGADELGLADVRGEWERARGKLLVRCAAVLAKLEKAGAPVAAASSSARKPT